MPRYSLDDYNIPDNFSPTPGYIADQEGIDPDLFERLISQESGFNPSAISPAGAIGLTQLMPGTASDLGVDPTDSIQNMYGGARYLGDQIDHFGSEPLGLAAFNAGPGAVEKAGGIPDFPETQDYVKNVFGKPLPSAADLSGSVLPSTSRRQDDLSNITNEISSLQDSKNQTLKDLSQQGQLDPSDAIAIALTAILPTVLGWATHGKQGAAGGATAGATGANLGLAGLTAEQQKRDATNKLIYEEDKQRIASKEGQADKIRDSIADREERNQELEALYPHGKNSAKAREPLSADTIKLIAERTGRTPQEVEALGKEDPYRLQTILYGLGANTKPLGDTAVEKIAGSKGALFSIDAAEGLAKQFEPGVMSALKAGKVTDWYKDPEDPAYKFYAQVDKLKKEVARMNDSGALSQADVDIFTPLTAGSPIYDSRASILERLAALREYVINKRDALIETSGMTGRNISGLNKSSTSSTSSTNSLPTEGEMFQGQRVKSVRKVS